MISIDIKVNPTPSIAPVTSEEEPSYRARLADKVRYCLHISAFAIGGGVCGIAGVFAYEWSRTAGSLSDDTPIWMALGGVVGGSCGNLLGVIWHTVGDRPYCNLLSSMRLRA